MKHIYYISGLGADERVFKFLSLKNVTEKHIFWIPPLQNESIHNYALRLSRQIDTSKPIILIGVSFGGVIAQEIAQHIVTEKVIIISSVKSYKELPFSLKFVRATQLHKCLPLKLLQWLNLKTANYYFGIETKQEATLLKAIIKDSDDKFTLWATDAIINWQGNYSTPNLTHIHGTKDKIFPKRKISNVEWVKNGGHFMIVNKANEITNKINLVL